MHICNVCMYVRMNLNKDNIIHVLWYSLHTSQTTIADSIYTRNRTPNKEPIHALKILPDQSFQILCLDRTVLPKD